MKASKKKSRKRIIAFGVMLILIGLILCFGFVYFKKVVGKTETELEPWKLPILISATALVIFGLLCIFLRPILNHRSKARSRNKEINKSTEEIEEALDEEISFEAYYLDNNKKVESEPIRESVNTPEPIFEEPLRRPESLIEEPVKPVEELKQEETPHFDEPLHPNEETLLNNNEINEVEEEIEPVIEQKVDKHENLQALSAMNYNATHSLQKARLVLDDEEDSNTFNSGLQKASTSSVFVEPTTEPQVEEVKPTVSAPINNVTQPTPNVFTEPKVEPIRETSYQQPKVAIKRDYKLPPMNLLDLHEKAEDETANEQSCQDRVNLINTIFEQLRVGAKAVSYTVGPSVTRYDIQTNVDVSVNVIQRYVQDISVRLGGIPTRFEPIVFGKATSGLEIPNEIRTNVGLRESIEALPQGEKFIRNIPFGKDISGKLVQANLQDFPHLLVSGTTGSGKSIFVHGAIMTLLMRNTPDQLRLVLIDPKKVEMSYYKDIPHLLCPAISDPKKAYVAFKKLVDEMERRYTLFETNMVRDIDSYNRFAKEKGLDPLPFIVVFVDEYADLNEACKEIREPVVRIAQKARSAGIHLVIATQRPSVNVIDGVIKANISTHVALMMANAVDSVTIIGEAGAEQLLGHGDMLVECALISRAGKPRVQGCYVDTSEICRVCDYLRSNYGANYDPVFMDLEEHFDEPVDSYDEPKVIDKSASEDQLYEMIKEDITSLEFCSISYIQRTYGVGFPKAGRLFNKLLKDGYVAREHDARGSKVLIRTNETQSSQLGSIEQSSFVPNSEETIPNDNGTTEQSNEEIAHDEI